MLLKQGAVPLSSTPLSIPTLPGNVSKAYLVDDKYISCTLLDNENV